MISKPFLITIFLFIPFIIIASNDDKVNSHESISTIKNTDTSLTNINLDSIIIKVIIHEFWSSNERENSLWRMKQFESNHKISHEKLIEKIYNLFLIHKDYSESSSMFYCIRAMKLLKSLGINNSFMETNDENYENHLAVFRSRIQENWKENDKNILEEIKRLESK